MSPILILILRFLHGAGVPIGFCEDHLCIGNGDGAADVGQPPMAPPPPHATTEDETSISNGF